MLIKLLFRDEARSVEGKISDPDLAYDQAFFYRFEVSAVATVKTVVTHYQELPIGDGDLHPLAQILSSRSSAVFGETVID